MKILMKLLKIVPLVAAAYGSSAQALEIKFNHAADMDARALAGFQAAADRWSKALHDDVTVNLDIGFSQLDDGVLGSTGSTQGFIDYRFFRAALAADAWGSTDRQAVANLPTGNCLSVLMNGTADNPNGVGSATPFVDDNCNDNNIAINMTWANARALGLAAARDDVVDGEVAFSSAFQWDFDPSDGITAGYFDFIGVAAHEIGHALGFISGVDTLDLNRDGPFPDYLFTYIAPADLFRCSPLSKSEGADLDWSADDRTKYFSLDNCNTTLATFSEGSTHGDGQQASHWKDNMRYGLLDPTAARGEVLEISALDLQMFDAIGWNVVPEPATLALFGFGAAGLAAARRRRAVKQA